MCTFFFRTIDGLLMLVEIDLLCDDHTQANSKLADCQRLLSEALTRNDLAPSRKPKVNKSSLAPVSTGLDASPSLHRSPFLIPSWLDHPDECCCYFCERPDMMSVLVNYLNLTGVWHHMDFDLPAAAAFFEGTLKLIRSVMQKCRKSDSSMPMEVKMRVIGSIFNSLQWQVECYGRDEYFTKCHELIELQKDLLLSFPCHFPWTRLRYYDQLLFSRLDSPLEISGIEMELGSLALSPRKNEKAEEFLTPMQKKPQSGRAPRRPNKKLLQVPN